MDTVRSIVFILIAVMYLSDLAVLLPAVASLLSTFIYGGFFSLKSVRIYFYLMRKMRLTR